MLVLALTLITVLALVLQPVWSYLHDKHTLRQFPSPSYAGLSSIWRILQNLRYKHYLAVHEAHQSLGTHIRIAPNHISISDPQAMSDIYGHGAGFLKDAWYDGGAGKYRHMADARDKAEHQAKRKKLAHVFAQKTIANLEPIIQDTISTFLTRVQHAAEENKSINMRRLVNYFTIDVFSRLLYGKSLGCLERGDDVVDAETSDGRVYKVPFIKSLHDATIINTVLGMEAGILGLTRRLLFWHPYKKAGADYDNIIYHNTRKRLEDEDATGDIFSSLLFNNKGEAIGMPLGEILVEASVMMNAGTDTTTAALTNTIFLLYKNPHVLSKLRQELDAHLVGKDRPSYDTVSQLPYLRAVVEESLRVRPASSMGLPRVVPKGGRIIAGRFVQGDVTVSVPTYTLLHNADAFDNPNEFCPDRWVTGDKEKMSKAHLPFSTGPRACIGRNIAYFEQLLLIASLVRNWDFEFANGPDFELQTFERFNSNPGELVMSVKKRSVA